jgi:hypothetical protein
VRGFGENYGRINDMEQPKIQNVFDFIFCKKASFEQLMRLFFNDFESLNKEAVNLLKQEYPRIFTEGNLKKRISDLKTIHRKLGECLNCISDIIEIEESLTGLVNKELSFLSYNGANFDVNFLREIYNKTTNGVYFSLFKCINKTEEFAIDNMFFINGVLAQYSSNDFGENLYSKVEKDLIEEETKNLENEVTKEEEGKRFILMHKWDFIKNNKFAELSKKDYELFKELKLLGTEIDSVGYKVSNDFFDSKRNNLCYKLLQAFVDTSSQILLENDTIYEYLNQSQEFIDKNPNENGEILMNQIYQGWENLFVERKHKEYEKESTCSRDGFNEIENLLFKLKAVLRDHVVFTLSNGCYVIEQAIYEMNNRYNGNHDMIEGDKNNTNQMDLDDCFNLSTEEKKNDEPLNSDLVNKIRDIVINYIFYINIIINNEEEVQKTPCFHSRGVFNSSPVKQNLDPDPSLVTGLIKT